MISSGSPCWRSSLAWRTSSSVRRSIAFRVSVGPATALGHAQTLAKGIDPKPRPRRPSRVSASTVTSASNASRITRPPNLIGVRKGTSCVEIAASQSRRSLGFIAVAPGEMFDGIPLQASWTPFPPLL